MSEIKVREPGEYLKNTQGKVFSSSLLTAGIRNEISMIKTEKIRSFDGQCRVEFGDEAIEKLADTVKRHGIRQPLTLLQSDEIGFFEVVSGERRLRAAKLAGMEKVPAIIIQNRALAEEIAIIENIHRKDLTLVEIGKNYSRLLDKNIMTNQGELSEKIGVSRGHISECLAFSKIPDEVVQLLTASNMVSRVILRKVVTLSDAAKMIEFINEEIKKNSSKNDNKKKKTESGGNTPEKAVEKKRKIVSIDVINNQYCFNQKIEKLKADELKSLKKLVATLSEEIDKALEKEGVNEQ
ncbi:MAG: ParB/RepB/Spo0J family partition protein [Oligoflexia bacterium]|nr:ParB/RepB/Spo0J family partition protein [Oligoflexia bacterium]